MSRIQTRRNTYVIPETILQSSEEEEDFSSGSDDDYIPDVAELESESEDSDPNVLIEQSTREQAVVDPNLWLLSKDKKIQYSRDSPPRNARGNVDGFVSGICKNNKVVTMCVLFYKCRYLFYIGPTAYALERITHDCSSSFILFLRPMEKIVIEMTNLYGVRKYGADWEMIDLNTFRAFLGLFILAGVYRSKGECTREMWDGERGRPIFRAVMSEKRFKLLLQCLRFDDKNDRVDRARDKLAPIRKIYDLWNRNLKNMYVIGDSITVDEQLIPFRGKSPFTQYMPSKPKKYGIKMWVACDSYSSYAYNTQVYTGRDRNSKPEIDQGKRVVLELTEGLFGRNVTCDNFFSSHALACELKQRKMTIVGTIRKNRKEIPPILLDVKKKPNFHSEFVFDHHLPLTMVSYLPKKNHPVILISTLHTGKKIIDEREKRPEIIHYYNKTKGGVDVLDERISTYRCKRKINRWPVAIFLNMIDISAFNAYVLFTRVHPNWNSKKIKYRRRLFLIELGEALTKPYIESRKILPKSWSSAAIVRKRKGLPEEPSASTSNTITKTPKSQKRSRCFICTSRNNPNLYSSRCDACKKFICNDHRYLICDKCMK